MTSVEDTMKNISQVILLSTSCLIWYGADNVCASVNVFSGIPKSGTHNTLHTTPYLAYPHLPHLRGERSVRGGMFRTERSAMLTSCLPQAQSSSSPEVGEAGGRKNSPVENFSTTGESLLTGEQVTTMQRQCYKPSDRSEVSEGRAYEARRRGVTSEASIPFSSNIEKMSLTGLIPPRELLTRLKSGEFLLPLPQGEDNKLNVFKTASVCFITDTGACSGRGGGENPVDPVNPIPPQPSPSEACEEAGYELTSCPSLSHGENFCPIDSSYFKTCVCDDNLKECHKPYYGVGPQCDGKYASCEKDTPRACKEDGYGQSGACPDLQTPNKKCPYDSAYYDKCVCRSDLVTCTYPQSGVGEACGGKYASCQCPGSYKSCECGGAAGATSCTVNGVTTYSSCKECCEPTCRDETNCGNGYVTQDNGCGGTCRVCKKEVMIHCSDGTIVSNASLCPKDPDGVEVDDGDFCIILSKYQGYGRGNTAIESTPPGWKFASLEVMKKASKHISAINRILNDMGEPNLYNDWYWTNTYHNPPENSLVWVVNPYTGEQLKSVGGDDAGISFAYYRYYKDCD